MRISSEVIEVLKVLVWPVTLLVSLLLFRRPIGRFLTGISGRVAKISVLEFALELSPAPTMRPVWEIRSSDVRRLTPSYLFDSPSGPYFEQLSHATGDYAVIDLGDGDQWISSRLYIFAALLGRITRVRQLVFVATQEGVPGRFLGMASPDAIRWALAESYP